MNIYLLFVLCASLNFHLTKSVKVSVYYEARCYDSVRFITSQLYPNYPKLKDYIQLEWVPYGKAIHNFVNNKWVFDCQHGPSECLGNKYQACVLAENNGQDKDVAFINCVMRERNPSDVRRMESCARRFDLNWKNITQCANNGRGDALLAKHGDRTNDLNPNLSFVPTVVYDDEYDDFRQSISLTDFPAVVCSTIEGSTPQFCRGRKMPQRRSFEDYFLG